MSDEAATDQQIPPSAGEPGDSSSDGVKLGDTLLYAFICLCIFFLVLLLFSQFEPLVRYTYPFNLLLVPLTVFFLALSILRVKGKIPDKTPRGFHLVPIFAGIAVCLALLVLLSGENPALLLLIPLALPILFLEFCSRGSEAS